MTTLTWEDLWEIETALTVRKAQVKDSMNILSKYADIVEMHTRELEKLEALEIKVSRARMETME
jgi:hypothetical protein